MVSSCNIYWLQSGLVLPCFTTVLVLHQIDCLPAWLQCYRLYTRSYFERKMPDTTPPEICRTSLSGAVLQLKALGLPGLDVLSFGFLDPPQQVRRDPSAASKLACNVAVQYVACRPCCEIQRGSTGHSTAARTSNHLTISQACCCPALHTVCCMIPLVEPSAVITTASSS